MFLHTSWLPSIIILFGAIVLAAGSNGAIDVSTATATAAAATVAAAAEFVLIAAAAVDSSGSGSGNGAGSLEIASSLTDHTSLSGMIHLAQRFIAGSHRYISACESHSLVAYQ